MIRILLPLAVIAAILFAPMYTLEVRDPVLGEKRVVAETGYAFVANTIECWRAGNFSLEGDCQPKGELKGKAIFAALFVSVVAAGLGVLGLIPIIGRLTSFVTMLAGVVVIAAVGYFALTMIGASKDGADALTWGSYLAGGGGLLTLISGLHGVRGKR